MGKTTDSIQLDESTKLDGHDISNIEFKASKDDVTITKVAGFDDYPLTSEWKAVCMSAGTFTVSATLDNLTSNTLTFTVKDKAVFNMECNIPNGYQLQYKHEYSDRGTTWGASYTITKLNDSYMIMSSNGSNDKFFEKIGNDSYKVYIYANDKTWMETRFTDNESEVLNDMLGILYPRWDTKTKEYVDKKEFDLPIDDKDYPVTYLAYVYDTGNVSYFYHSGADGLKVCIETQIFGAPNVVTELSMIEHIKTVSEFPVNPPSAE